MPKPLMHRHNDVHRRLWLFCLKIIGVKFKVFVKDRDTKFFEGGDDDVDEFVQLLQLTPALNVSIANWTNITMHGLRRKHKTR